MLYIIRGLPGSGKSTLARQLVDSNCHFEADMFHIQSDGEYVWKAENTKAAHDWCYSNVTARLLENNSVAVSNTFTRKWEYEKYIEFCKMYDIPYQVIEVYSEFKNIHNVPENSIVQMKERWESHKDYYNEITK